MRVSEMHLYKILLHNMLAKSHVSTWFSPLALCKNPAAFEQSLDYDWVAVKELNLSYYIRETLVFAIYTHYGNLI